jgi:hypothetical protein
MGSCRRTFPERYNVFTISESKKDNIAPQVKKTHSRSQGEAKIMFFQVTMDRATIRGVRANTPRTVADFRTELGIELWGHKNWRKAVLQMLSPANDDRDLVVVPLQH